MPSELEREIGRLAGLARNELTTLWTKAWRYPPPRGAGRGLLELGIAWHLQARHSGDHSPAVKRQLRRLIAERECAGSDRGRAAASNRKGNPGGPKGAQYAVLAPGTRLMREWHGRSHCVDVIDNGFVFEGRTYPSLSAIARTITGSRWSGPRFFGV